MAPFFAAIAIGSLLEAGRVPTAARPDELRTDPLTMDLTNVFPSINEPQSSQLRNDPTPCRENGHGAAARKKHGCHLPREIRVTALTPSPIDTPILGKVFPSKDVVDQVREKTIGMILMRRFGTSGEIAKVVLILAFDATFTTGAELPVDGGWSQL